MNTVTFFKLNEINSIFKIALPLMAAFLAQKGMQLIDTLMMGWIGPHALAAGALSTSLFMVVLAFCTGTLSAIGIFIIRARGGNQDHLIKSNLQSGLILSLLLSLPGMILIWYMPFILSKVGEDPLVVKNTLLFLHGLVWGFPGMLLFLVLREFISAFSLARAVMFVCLCSTPLTFLLNYIFIYGKCGLPPLGVAGIGYASACVMWFMFFALLHYCLRNPILKPHVPSLFKFNLDTQQIVAMFSLGAPSGLILLLDMGMFSFAAILMGHFGVDALAAYQIAIQCATIAYAAPFGLSMATALQVGHAAASKNLQQAKRFTAIGLGIGLSIGALIALLFLFIPGTLTNLFLNSNELHYPAIYQYAVSFLIVAALFQCCDALQAIMNGALRGVKDTFVPMLLCLSCYWILGVGSAYYLSYYTQLSALGIWYGLSIGICSAGVILTTRFFMKFKHYSKKYVVELCPEN